MTYFFSYRGAAGRLKGLDDQLKLLKGEQEDLTKQWNAEKDQMRSLQGIKEEIDRVNLEIQSAERDYDLNRAAELKYGTLLDLQKKLSDTEKKLEDKVSRSVASCVSEHNVNHIILLSPCKFITHE